MAIRGRDSCEREVFGGHTLSEALPMHMIDASDEVDWFCGFFGESSLNAVSQAQGLG